MFKRYELHNHTTQSDASISCEDLIRIMEGDRVDAFALTDHNTISGHRIVRRLLEAGGSRVQCVYGMEYTTYYGHILCLNLKDTSRGIPSTATGRSCCSRPSAGRARWRASPTPSPTATLSRGAAGLT
jgi:predicted metal-dependent phosphoesterase TrpH